MVPSVNAARARQGARDRRAQVGLRTYSFRQATMRPNVARGHYWAGGFGFGAVVDVTCVAVGAAMLRLIAPLVVLLAPFVAHADESPPEVTARFTATASNLRIQRA